MRYLLVPLFLSLGTIYAQMGQTGISGRVTDGNDHPIPYASIGIYQPGDSSLILEDVSNEQGVFSIPLESGNYLIQFSFLSFQDRWLDGIKVTTGKTTALGTITLSPKAEIIEGATVEAERSQMQLALDKRVFNVGTDLTRAGGSASDILDNVPSVSVDVEGNVSLRGSGNVRILINGKPSNIYHAGNPDALRSLPADLIEKIEVITNPSARYDAEGEVGIINIVLKKEQENGFNGSVSAHTGYPHNHGAAINLNYRTRGINLFGNYGINYRKNPGSGYSYEELYLGDTTLYFERFREHERGGLSNNIRLGADFTLAPKSTLTLLGGYSIENSDNNSTLTYLDYNNTHELIQTTHRTDNEAEDEQNLSGLIRWSQGFKQKGRELTIEARYMQSADLETSNIEELIQDDPSADIYQRSSNDENNRNWLFQVDYIHPFAANAKFEGGWKSDIGTILTDYKVEEQNDQSEWIALSDFTNTFSYTSNIHAAYLIFSNKWNRFGYQAGIRAEYSDITTLLAQNDFPNERDYLDFFPSAHVTYEFKDNNSLQLSYSRRINRPGFWSLNPFFSFSDSRTFYSGNPDIEPEYTNSFELGHLKYWEKSSLFSSIYYRNSQDIIQRIYTVDSTGFTRIFPVNAGTRNAYGVELNFSKDIRPWWRLSTSANFYQEMVQGNYEGLTLDYENLAWDAKASSKVTFLKEWEWQTSARYRSPQSTSQGSRDATLVLDMALARDILKGNGTLILNVSDLLNSRKHQGTSVGDNFYIESEFQWHSRQTTLTFSYRINQKKRKGGEGERGGDYDPGDMGM